MVFVAAASGGTYLEDHYRKTRTMKKTIASGLIGLMALGGGVAIAAPSAFAQETDDLAREQRMELHQAERAERMAERQATLTEVLGVSADELQAARDADQTIADIAAAQGLDLQTVVDALVANAQANIDEKLAAGDIDADRAAEISDGLVDRVTARVNGEHVEGGRGHRGHHGPRGLGADAGAAPAADTAVADA